MGLADDISQSQNAESLRRFLNGSAEKFYRLRACPNCGRHRMYVCRDGRLRCEKCSLDEPATEEDLAAVFGDIANFVRVISQQATK
jgi:uncharacterized protein (DUF983 family)